MARPKPLTGLRPVLAIDRHPVSYNGIGLSPDALVILARYDEALAASTAAADVFAEGLAVPHAGFAGDDVDRALVVFVEVRLGAGAGRRPGHDVGHALSRPG